jgi:hypothetical protein
MKPKPGNRVTEAPSTLAGWQACAFVSKNGWDALGVLLAKCGDPSIIKVLDITPLDPES